MDYCKRSGSVMAVDYSLSAFKGANQIFTGYPLVIAQTMNKKKKKIVILIIWAEIMIAKIYFSSLNY